MLLYITTGEPIHRQGRPLHSVPETLTGLYDLGMREHARRGVLLEWQGDEPVETPDWRFDRLVIRIALYCRERLGIGRGESVAILGPLTPQWLACDYAVLGLGCVSVGLAHTLSDTELKSALHASSARVAFATDFRSADRLRAITGTRLETVITPGTGDGTAVQAFDAVWAQGSVLDTPEHAQAFRRLARSLLPADRACQHFATGEAESGRVLTHGEVMAQVKNRLLSRPARKGDIAVVEGTAASWAVRSACYAFVGDGYTTVAFARPGGRLEDVARLRPARLLASADLLTDLWRAVEQAAGHGVPTILQLPGLGWLRARVFAARVAQAFRERVGDALRSIEAREALAPELQDALVRHGLTVVADASGD